MINAQDVMAYMSDFCAGQMTDAFPPTAGQTPAQTTLHLSIIGP